MKRFIEG
jgi:hypothetical protein